MQFDIKIAINLKKWYNNLVQVNPLYKKIKGSDKKMSTLYTSVSEYGKKEIVILNSRYSREEIAEKLKPANYDKERLEHIVNEGTVLLNDIKIKAHADGVITTQRQGSQYFFRKGDTVIVHPDGAFSIKH